jgi:GNAT superfamily N-acetyltransferase
LDRFLREAAINPPNSEWAHGAFVVTTDPAAVDVDLTTSFLANDSYWALGRTRTDEERAIANSRCYTVLRDGAQVGGARAVTDDAFFAWIADVFVVPAARGQGVGKLLVRCITEDLAHVERLFLGTRDAHGLYAQFGFATPPRQERWMERLRPS